MKKLKVFLLLSFLFVISAGPLMAQRYKSENLFYLTSSMDGFQSFKEHASEISIVVPAVYNVDGYGVIAGSMDHRIMDIAKKNGVKVMPLIGTMNQKNIHHLVSDSASRARMINMMLYLAKENNYYGWQFDLENIHLTDRDNYTSFFKQAADSLHKHGYKISMAVVKFDRPTPEPGHSVSYTRYVYENWRGAFDIKALAKASDFLSLMTYDENTAQTPPGPVAGIPWMEKIVKYFLSEGIPAQKISFGIPSYSDYWYPTYSEKSGGHATRSEISYRKAEDLINRFNAPVHWMSKQGVDYTYWYDNGVFNWLFLENTKSFETKLALLPKYHFRGISVWVLGTEDPGIWKVLKKKTDPVKYH